MINNNAPSKNYVDTQNASLANKMPIAEAETVEIDAISSDYELGGIYGTTGTPSVADTVARTIVNEKYDCDTLTITSTLSEVLVRVYGYTSATERTSETYVSSIYITGDTPITINIDKDVYYAFGIKKPDDSAYSDISEFDTLGIKFILSYNQESQYADVAPLKRVEEIETYLNVDSIVGRNKDIEYLLHQCCNKGLTASIQKDIMLLIGTDFHADKTRLESMIEYLNTHADLFDACINLGDTTAASYNENTAWYNNGISDAEKPVYTVIGNHDAGNSAVVGTGATVSQMFTKFIQPNLSIMGLDYTLDKTYYYKDFTGYKIRLIVLNSYDLPDENDGTNFTINRKYLGWSQGQIDWLITILNSTPTDYSVLIAMHDQNEVLSVDTDSNFTNASKSMTPKTSIVGEVIADIVNAWITGGSLTDTYPATITTADFTELSVSADFTARGAGKFICYVRGDRHVDCVYSITAHPDQIGICFSTANYSSVAQRYAGDLPRNQGVKSEDCLTAISIDTAAKCIKLLRIGADVTRSMVSRRMTCIEY